MNTNLKNMAYVNGTIDNKKVTIPSNEVNVELSNGIRVLLSADQEVWYNGPLNYTITITNLENVLHEDVIITTTIDPKIARLEESTIQEQNTISSHLAKAISNINFPYTYDPMTGLLTIMIGHIQPYQQLIITFGVNRVSDNWSKLSTFVNYKSSITRIKSNTVVVTNIRRQRRGGRCDDPFFR